MVDLLALSSKVAKRYCCWLKPCAQKRNTATTQPQPAPAAADLVQTRVSNDPEAPPISVAQRWAEVQQQHKELKRRRHHAAAVEEQVQAALLLGTPTARIEGFPAADSVPTFDLHASHSYLPCGGFAGCIRCGAVAGWNMLEQQSSARTGVLETVSCRLQRADCKAGAGPAAACVSQQPEFRMANWRGQPHCDSVAAE